MTHITKISALLLCLLLAFGMTLPICASEEAEEVPQWVLSENEQTLTWGDRVYFKYQLPTGIWIRPYVFYQYNQYVGEDLLVGCPGYIAEDESLVKLQDTAILYDFLSQYSSIAVYVQGQGKTRMDAFVAGEYAQYELAESYNKSSVIGGEMIARWNQTTPDLTVEVTALANAPLYYVLGYDQTLTLAHVIGTVFELEGTYLYVHYDALDNSYFDADGNLSFRSGSVPALRLDATDSTTVANAIENAERYSTDIHREPAEPFDAVISMIVFLLMASPLLFILPTLLLALGIVMRCVKKIPNRKRWNAIIILSSVWLGGSFVTSLLLLIPTFFL